MSDVAELSKRVDELTKRFDEWLDAQRSTSQRRDDLVQAIIEKTLAGAFWALVVFLCKTFLDHVPLDKLFK